jgi:hypothetical protein
VVALDAEQELEVAESVDAAIAGVIAYEPDENEPDENENENRPATTEGSRR